MYWNYFLLYASCFVLIFPSIYCLLQCTNQDGDPVDWYVLYKLPRIENSVDADVQKGIAYMFITSDKVLDGWQYSNIPITSPDSISGKTLSPIFAAKNSNNNTIFWLVYNDQPPNEPYVTTQGHTKGVVVGNKEGGFWLVHSVPKFLSVQGQDNYTYPPTGTIYGQSFLCVSLTSKDLNKIGLQLIVNHANVYDSVFGSNMSTYYPDLWKASQKQRVTTKKRTIIFKSLNHQYFMSFAKSEKFNSDLYSDWVSGKLKSGLYVETWSHEKVLPSVCNATYPVHNVEEVTFRSTNIDFLRNKDHAKWAVTTDRNDPWICIGDINRSYKQLVRAGGTVCMNNSYLWPSYYKIVATVEPCSNRTQFS